MPSIGETLQRARQALTGIETASLDAQLLLCAVLDVPRTTLLAYPERTLTDEQAAAYEALIARRAAGEPVAYLLGQREFFGLDFAVTPAVLIPRPETEHLVEAALAWLAQHPAACVADIGTGSGAIAVSVALHAPQAPVYAVDISEEALALAAQNAARHQARVTFLQGDLLEPLRALPQRVDLLLANLPYIATEEVPRLEVSRHEPHLALDGGLDGLRLIERLLRTAPELCAPDALLLLEIGADQGEALRQMAEAILAPRCVEIRPDYAGLDRLVVIQR